MTTTAYRPPAQRKRRSPAATRLATVDGRKVPVRSEHLEQVYLFDWAQITRRARPALRWLHAIPNGGHRHAATAGKLRAEGVRPGVCDLFLDVPCVGEGAPDERNCILHVTFHGLRIELKAIDRRGEKNGGCSADQVEWLRHYEEQGYAVAVCYGWREAADVIERYLDGQHVNRLPEFKA